MHEGSYEHFTCSVLVTITLRFLVGCTWVEMDAEAFLLSVPLMDVFGARKGAERKIKFVFLERFCFLFFLFSSSMSPKLELLMGERGLG